MIHIKHALVSYALATVNGVLVGGFTHKDFRVADEIAFADGEMIMLCGLRAESGNVSLVFDDGSILTRDIHNPQYAAFRRKGETDGNGTS